MRSGPAAAGKLVTDGGELIARMYGSPVPIVIACTGHAIAAGALMLMGADARVAPRAEHVFRNFECREIPVEFDTGRCDFILAERRAVRRRRALLVRSAVADDRLAPDQRRAGVGLGFLDWKSAPAIFYTSSVLLEFLLGVIVYFLTRSSRLALSRPLLGAILAAAALLLSLDNGDAARGFADGPFAAVIVWVAVQWPWNARIDWLRSLGDASYSIYLFHLASFGVAGWLLHRAGVEAPTPLGVGAAMTLHLATAIVAGLLIHRFIERPLLRLLRRRLPRSDSQAARPALD